MIFVRCVGGVLASPLYFCMCIRFTLRGREKRRKRGREGVVREEGREEVSNERMRRERGREGGRDDERREGGRDDERRKEGVTTEEKGGSDKHTIL